MIAVNPNKLLVLAVAVAAALQVAPVAAQSSGEVEEVVVTARLKTESVQDVPIAVSVINQDKLDASGSSTLLQATSLAPSTQYISSNPRNTSITIRGLGSAYGLTNDGLDPGVGIYIDQVYHPRPSAASFDMLDVERVEVLRGPQGTLYGKNTTAGALNVTTRSPSFTPEGQFEISAGDFGFEQAKGFISGPLGDKLAGKLSLTRSVREGSVFNVTTGRDVNETDNQAVNGELLFRPNDNLKARFILEDQQQSPECCTQVFVRVGATLRAPARQFDAMAATLGYVPPSRDPYDRIADVNSGSRSDQKMRTATAIVDWNVAGGTLTSVTSSSAWQWRPLNDRDYTALSILTKSSNNSNQRQKSQEVRFAKDIGTKVDYVVGAYAFSQSIATNGLQGYGSDAAFWLVNATVPRNLLDGYTSTFTANSTFDSYALFGQVDWHITDKFTFTPGVRYTDDSKSAVYDQTVAGGLATADPALVNFKLGIVRPQFYRVDDYSDASTSGQLSFAFAATRDLLLYANLAKGYKSGGINLAGIPNDAAGNPSLIAAVVKPEDTSHVEIGIKSQFLQRSLTANFALFNTHVKDYQSNVVDNGPGALRGYLANIQSVRVRGLEADFTWSPTESFTGYFSAAWSDGRYASFANAPCPLELVGGPAVCDLSGRALPALPDRVATLGGEYHRKGNLFGATGQYFVGVDTSYRSSWYSDASVSQYSLIEGYSLANLRGGYRSNGPWEVALWVRNVTDKDYLQFVSIQSGNAGLVIGTPGEPRAAGLTVRARF